MNWRNTLEARSNMANLRSNILRLVAGVAAILTLAGAAWMMLPFPPEPTEEVAAAFSGALLLEQYQCRRGETAGMIIRGVEDGYRPGNREVGRFERFVPNRLASIGLRNYDDRRPDAELFDYFELPQDTVSGLFVVRLTQPTAQENDNLILGSLADNNSLGRDSGGNVFSESIVTLEEQPGWSRRTDIYWVALEDVVLQSGETLVDYVRAPHRDGVIDLEITDDTAVDFAGVAFCIEPAQQTGLTFWVDAVEASPSASTRPADEPHNDSYIVATCANDPGTRPSCEPFLGDTRCNRSVPLICFKPDQRPYPNHIDFTGRLADIEGGFWSAGELALTSPVPGNQFATIDDANSYCRSEFGDEWRVADFHLDAQGFRFWGSGNTSYSGRAWVDIRDQPYGTCWGRS